MTIWTNSATPVRMANLWKKITKRKRKKKRNQVDRLYLLVQCHPNRRAISNPEAEDVAPVAVAAEHVRHRPESLPPRRPPRNRAPRENPLVAVPLRAKGGRPKLAARSVAGKKPLRNPARERVSAPVRANGSPRAANAGAKSFPKTSGGLPTSPAARRIYFRCPSLRTSHWGGVWDPLWGILGGVLWGAGPFSGWLLPLCPTEELPCCAVPVCDGTAAWLPGIWPPGTAVLGAPPAGFMAPTWFPIASPLTISSTRRFNCRPVAVAFEATGWVLPKP